MRRLCTVILAAPLLLAQNIEPKPKVTDYPAHAALPKLSIGAEYMVRSFSGQGEMFFTEDYLVIEIAAYPARGETVSLAASHFTLRMNGKKQVLFPQPPAFVAASLKYADWEYRPTIQAGGQVGDTSVILGRPDVGERFPGDARRQRTRLPAPPKAPTDEDRSGLGPRPKPTPAEVAVTSALAEGAISHPVGGYLYFAFRGKTKSIKSLDLLYTTETDSAVLHLCCSAR